MVVDKDRWEDDQLMQLHQWSLGAKNYGFALSNPKFEYWLLLHFEEGNNVPTSRECSLRLGQHLFDYDKGINPRKVTLKKIHDAVRRAKLRDNPPCDDWPRSIGATTVYKLVERVLECGKPIFGR